MDTYTSTSRTSEVSALLYFYDQENAKEYRRYQRKQFFLPSFYFAMCLYTGIYFVRGSLEKAAMLSLGPVYATGFYEGNNY